MIRIIKKSVKKTEKLLILDTGHLTGSYHQRFLHGLQLIVGMI